MAMGFLRAHLDDEAAHLHELLRRQREFAHSSSGPTGR